MCVTEKQAAVQADEIAGLPGNEVMDEIWKCLKMKWYRKLERIVAALVRRRRPPGNQN